MIRSIISESRAEQSRAEQSRLDYRLKSGGCQVFFDGLGGGIMSLLRRRMMMQAKNNTKLDTTPVIAEYDKSLNAYAGVGITSGACYTDFYLIPEGATDVTLFFADSEDISVGSRGKLQFWDDTQQIEYWSVASTRNAEKTYKNSYGATRFRTSLATNGIEDSYAYDSTTGHIYFAGKNTQYYGKQTIYD